MKKTILLVSIFSLGLAINLSAQAPQAIQYQTIIRNAQGEVVMNQGVSLQLTILQGSAMGTQTYQETHTATTNAFGLVNLQIGTGTSSDDFSTINWSLGDYFLKVALDLSGGSSFTEMGTTQLLSVPYALYAESAGKVNGAHYVGEVFDGGIVFFVDETGQHGLMASLEDLNGGTPVVWSNVMNTLIGASAQNFYDGAPNTAAIIAQAGHTSSAAELCDVYAGGGKTDWYLPSSQELYLLGNNSWIINKILANDGNSATNGLNVVNDFFDSTYWSSTEANNAAAWILSLQSNSVIDDTKNVMYRVRAVRAF